MRPVAVSDASRPLVTACVSGSFRRFMSQVQAAVYALTDIGVAVLSPADPRVVGQFGDFLFVASDKVRALRLVQNRHLAAIAAADFVWLVAPDGYVGQSGAMEIGYAAAVGTPVYTLDVPSDLTLRQYVTITPTLKDAVRARGADRPRARSERADPLLLDPVAAMETAHADLDRLSAALTRSTLDPTQAEVITREVYQRLGRRLL
jgi:hypothetical protein